MLFHEEGHGKASARGGDRRPLPTIQSSQEQAKPGGGKEYDELLAVRGEALGVYAQRQRSEKSRGREAYRLPREPPPQQEYEHGVKTVHQQQG